MADKIKKLVEGLREDAYWASCNEWETPITLGDHLNDAADLIEALAAELAQVKRERDAAVEDIKIAALHLCDTCKHRMPDERCRHFGGRESDAIVCGAYEWRGVEE